MEKELAKVKMSSESILGMELANYEETMSFSKKLDVVETTEFWGRGVEYLRVREGIERKEIGFNKWDSFNAYCTCKNFLHQAAYQTMAAFHVVEYLKEKGIAPNDLPKKQFHAKKLSTHHKTKWVKLWKEHGSKVEAFKEKLSEGEQEDIDFNKKVKSLIPTMQLVERELSIIMKRMNEGGVISANSTRVIFKAALNELGITITNMIKVEQPIKVISI